MMMGMVLVSGALAQEEDEGISIEYSDADLAAVDKIKEAGALVLEVAQNDNRLNVAFHLTTAEVGNEQVSLVKDLPFIVSLNLRGTQVNDEGAALLAGMSGLERLHLEKTGVTDAALNHLTGLENLKYLNVYGTEVTDAAIDTIAGIKGLEKVYIWQTKITIDGVAKLKEKRPELKIIPDLVVEKAKAEAEAVRKAEEEKKKAEE
ncbi:MAG TPA: hypothetical protein DCP67_12865, partial [Planctomycetaceae bacterium]|nr:hypothetical protein [Planctomycetaceae bacterium]